MTEKNLISFVIPVYRNEGAVALTYEKIKTLFEKVLNRFSFEIIFVDDGSDDNSLKELLELRSRDLRVKVLSFTRNFGQVAAILAGYKEAKGDAVITVSADLQDPIELVEEMIRSWKAGSEVVICHREDRQDTFFSKLFSKVAYSLIRISYPDLPPGGFDYILMDQSALKAFNAVEVRNRFFQGDVLWLGYRRSYIPYTRVKREIGKSQWSLSKKLKYFLDAILDSSYLPIRFISLTGFVTAALGFIYTITIVYLKISHQTPFTGWAPIMIIVLVVGGIIMLMLGIIGEYIWRIYDEVKKKPSYILRERHTDSEL